MPSKIKDQVFREIEKYELEGYPKGWTIKDYIKAIGEGVDPEIRGFVEALLSLGYPTDASCAGGSGHITSTGGMGFVDILEDLDKDEKREIRGLAAGYGITGISFRPMAEYSTRVVFNPMGGPSRPT